MTRTFLAAGFACFVSFTACAAEFLTLDEVYVLALKKSERAKISEEDVRAALENIRLARAAVLPNLSTSMTHSRNKQAGSGGFTTFRRNRDVEIELSQPLYGGGKEWAVLRGAKIEVEISESRLLLVKQSALFDAAAAYFSLLRAQEKLNIARRALDLARDQRSLAVARREAGTATRTEVIRADVAVSTAERDLIRAENDVSVFRARLGFAIGQNVSKPVARMDEDSADLGSKNMETYVQGALRVRPDYRILDLSLKIAEEGVKVARAAFSPTAKLSGDFSRAQHVTSFRDPENWHVQALVEYDIFDGLGRNAEYEKSKIALRQAALEQMVLAREIELEVHESLLEITALTAIREAAAKEAGAARENYERVIEQFREGLSTGVDVADAHTALIAAEVERATADSDIQFSRRKLELALGTIGQSHLKSTEVLK